MNKQKIAKYFGYKLIRFIVLMIAVAIFSFVLLDLSPIDPVSAYLKGAAVSEEQRQILQQYFGTNVPLPTKIYHWLLDLIQGNLGTSLIYRRPVMIMGDGALGQMMEPISFESVKKLEIKEFPLIVAIDCHGGNLFER